MGCGLQEDLHNRSTWSTNHSTHPHGVKTAGPAEWSCRSADFLVNCIGPDAFPPSITIQVLVISTVSVNTTFFSWRNPQSFGRRNRGVKQMQRCIQRLASKKRRAVCGRKKWVTELIGAFQRHARDRFGSETFARCSVFNFLLLLLLLLLPLLLTILTTNY